jgi:streptomycin 6-kinase
MATTSSGGEAVLKLTAPWARGADEAAALRAWGGNGAPCLLNDDAEVGAILLERIRPGSPATGEEPAEVAALLSRLHVPPPEGLPALDEIVGRGLESAMRERRASARRLQWAATAHERCRAGAPASVLVHGHLDEGNLLHCRSRTLCAIDPSPAAGDPLYDAASWIHAAGRPGRRARFDALTAALSLDEPSGARLRDWCGIVAVLG